MNAIDNWENKVNWLKLENGLRKYLVIMEQVKTSENLFEDSIFRTNVNGFYRIRQRKKEFYDSYFTFMESNKNNENITFEETLRHFYSMFNRIEKSFSSKLVATINPELPVWDTVVVGNINSQLNQIFSKNIDNIQVCINKYDAMNEWYINTLKSVQGKDYVERFDFRFPDCSITNLKKIDLILWQTRS